MAAEAMVRAGGKDLHVVGTVRGLVSEAARVEEAFHRVQPQGVALGVGPEDLAGIERLDAGEAYEHDYSEADDIYAHYLGQFGPVELPPRDLLAAVREARARGLPLVAIDLPEAEYVDAFTKAISGWELLRYNRRVRRLARKPIAADDAMAFHLWWDAQIRRLKGFAALEGLREQRMAARLLGDELPRGRVLVLVEAARVAGLVEALRSPIRTPAHPKP